MIRFADEDDWKSFAILGILFMFVARCITPGAGYAGVALASGLVFAVLGSAVLWLIGALLLMIIGISGTKRKLQFMLSWTLSVRLYLLMGLGASINATILLLHPSDHADPFSMLALPSPALFVTGPLLRTVLYQFNVFSCWWYALIVFALVERFGVRKWVAISGVALGAIVLSLTTLLVRVS